MANRNLRVSSGAIKIDVNDDGEYITLNPSDAKLVSGFGKLKTSLEAKVNVLKARSDEIGAENISEEDKVSKLLDFNCSIHKEIADEVDILLGADTCRKVFGAGVVPDSISFVDFFEALSPFVKEIAAEQAGKMSKYSAERVGNN